MNCEKCGSFIQEGQSYCNNCGAPVKIPASQQPVYQQPIYQQSAYQQPIYQQPIYQQPIYQQQVVSSTVPLNRNNGFATAGLIIGIFSACFCWVPGIGVILALLAIVFSVIGLVKKIDTGKGKAIAGIVLGGIALPVAFIVSAAMMSTSSNDYSRVSNTASSTSSSTRQTSRQTTQKTTRATTETTVEELHEINSDIPVGTTYELGQGNFEVGEDIPAGRYRIEWIDGNQFGGYMEGASGNFVDSYIILNPEEPYICILEDGMTFSISLITARFTKVSSLPNNDYLQDDGSYVLCSGYFFEGVDIPCGKYDVTAISGNRFGLDISTYNDSYIALDINETYSNLKLNHEGKKIKISLGTIRLDPK